MSWARPVYDDPDITYEQARVTYDGVGYRESGRHYWVREPTGRRTVAVLKRPTRR